MIFHADGATLRGFNRAFRPYLLGLSLGMMFIAQQNFRGMDRGIHYPLSIAVALIAGGSAAMILWGWIGRWQFATVVGLAGAFFAYIVRAAFIFIESGAEQAIAFSLIAAATAGGAYLLEARQYLYGGGRR